MSDQMEVLRRVYDLFNAQDIESALAAKREQTRSGASSNSGIRLQIHSGQYFQTYWLLRA